MWGRVGVATDGGEGGVDVCVGSELVLLIEGDHSLGYFEKCFFDAWGGGREGKGSEEWREGEEGEGEGGTRK